MMSEDEMRKEENLEHEVLDRLKNLEPMDFNYNAVDASYVDAVLKARNIILGLYQKEKEKNKELQSYMKTNLIPKSTINLLYISKGNIRELLEKYDKDIAWDSADDHYYFTKFIQELLEENNGKND